MVNLFEEFRYAVRRLRERPTFLLTAVLSLALGIGFGTVIFNFVSFLLLRPLPIDRPEQVVSLDFGRGPAVSYPNYTDIRDRNGVFSAVSALRVVPMNMSSGAGNMRLWGYLVTGNYFDLLGIRAYRGQLFSGADDLKAGAHPVAVISFGCWQRRFGGDAGIVGRSVRINGHTFTVVGITPPGFVGTEVFFASEIWVPMSMIREIEGRDWRDSRSILNAWALARLRPGMSMPQAESQLRVLAAQMAQEHPDSNEGLQIRLSPPGLLGNSLRRPVMAGGAALLVLSVLTLLVACVNLSGLLLAQAAERRKELAIRLTVGASRASLVRMMLIESLLLAGLAGSLGLVTSFWLSGLLSKWIPALEFPINTQLAMDWRVFVFAAAVSFFSAVIFGVLPALRATAVDVAPALKDEPIFRRIGRFHLIDVYVAVQVVVCVVLLAVGMMMVRTLQQAGSLRYGFDPDGAVVLRFDVGLQGYSMEMGRDFQRRVLERVRALPGIKSASLANTIPFSIDQSSGSVFIEGKPIPQGARIPVSVVYQVAPDFFRTMGTRLVSGREFDEHDREGSPQVVIINQTFADRLLAGEAPIGKRFRLGRGELAEVVGVVEAGKYQSISEDPQPAVWQPLAQHYKSTSALVARTDLSEREAVATTQRIIEELDPELPVYEARTLRRYLDLPMMPLRFTTVSLIAMCVLAMFLGGVGVYALLSNSTAQRSREIGVRIALGARPADVLFVVLKRMAAIVGTSTIVGLAVSFAATRLLARVFFALPDASIYAAALLLLAILSFFACFIPARRALRIQPASAIRSE
jgi:predicted permease